LSFSKIAEKLEISSPIENEQKSVYELKVYSPQWWARIGEAIDFVAKEARPQIILGVIMAGVAF